MDQDLQLYEIGYLLKNDGSEEKLQKSIARIRMEIQALKGIIIEEMNPKRHNLSYPILKNNEAFFGLIKFLCAKENINKITDNFKKSPDIIRSLIVKVNYKKSAKIKKQPSYKKKGFSEEKQEQIKEIDKKLEEILGK
jgi:ribosomal protein S6